MSNPAEAITPPATTNDASETRAPSAYYRTLVTSGHAPVNGFALYYEIHGTGTARPLVTIHPALGTANVFPSLARNRQLIAVEMQGHGRSTDIDRPLTFEQEADDIAALLQYLDIERADFFGESAGSTVALLMAIRHPGLVRRVATYGGGSFAAFGAAGNLNPLMHIPSTFSARGTSGCRPTQQAGRRCSTRSAGWHGRAFQPTS